MPDFVFLFSFGRLIKGFPEDLSISSGCCNNTCSGNVVVAVVVGAVVALSALFGKVLMEK